MLAKIEGLEIFEFEPNFVDFYTILSGYMLMISGTLNVTDACNISLNL